jgi:hypothetical protein
MMKGVDRDGLLDRLRAAQRAGIADLGRVARARADHRRVPGPAAAATALLTAPGLFLTRDQRIFLERLLKAGRGGFVAREDLAHAMFPGDPPNVGTNKLGRPRMALAAKLRRQGYDIATRPRRGYALVERERA